MRVLGDHEMGSLSLLFRPQEVVSSLLDLLNRQEGRIFSCWVEGRNSRGLRGSLSLVEAQNALGLMCLLLLPARGLSSAAGSSLEKVAFLELLAQAAESHLCSCTVGRERILLLG